VLVENVIAGEGLAENLRIPSYKGRRSKIAQKTNRSLSKKYTKQDRHKIIFKKYWQDMKNFVEQISIKFGDFTQPR